MAIRRLAILLEGVDSQRKVSVLQQFEFDTTQFGNFLLSPAGVAGEKMRYLFYEDLDRTI